MSNPYTRRFGFADLPAGTPLQIGAVPDGKHWIIRDLVVFNGFAAESGMTVYLQTGSGIIMLWSLAAAPLSTTHLELRQAANFGDELWASSAGGGCQVLVTGYELDIITPAPGNLALGSK